MKVSVFDVTYAYRVGKAILDFWYKDWIYRTKGLITWMKL